MSNIPDRIIELVRTAFNAGYDSGQQHQTAAAIAHRACCGTEHDPSQGKLHGYCVVCGVPWPCDTAKQFLAPKELKHE